MGFELLTAMQERLGHVFFDGTIGDVEFLGGFGIGHAVNSIHDKYLPSAQRQLIQYPRDGSQSFVDGYKFLGGREFALRGWVLFFRLFIIFSYFSMLDVIVSKVFGNSEQKAARMIDSLFLCFAEKNNEAFLSKIGSYIRTVDNPGQMKLQFGLVI